MPRAIHHWDLWVNDAALAADEWGWLLGEVGWEIDLPGQSWVHPDGTYLFVERSPDQVDELHDRLRPGVNHLALTVGTRELLDRVRAESTAHGWHELYAARYPHAGGDDHVALYLENSEGFEVEVVLAP
ncbi:glyoxalase [Nocardioides dongxiaopingii]|uniref:VOC family protein n=1 Tax=Nocardioides sp. S-1144 TaxID=2582905 RepID=UPI00110D6DF4|nr:VOC family protein [Nocardioides sp. S-1144]QCW50143.1 glyoxalase [Nocardioides sp. S-1144]